MNQQLTEKVLASVMDWGTIEVAENIRGLEHIAELKYDQYQQYEVGSRFIENLVIWLSQFENVKERRDAFEFVKNHIVFISQEELYHLINSIYPDLMRPIFKNLAKDISAENNVTDKETKQQIAHVISRQSLIFGLSDGARLDVFRRGAPQISNEQVCISYEITESRMKSIKEEMKKDTEEFYKRNALNGMKPDKIYNVFLLDDFSGSGISYLRIEKDASGKKIWKGKIKKVIDQLEDQVKGYNNLTIHIILYLATEKAEEHIKKYVKKYASEKQIKMEIHILQKIHSYIPDVEIKNLMIKYHNSKIEDSHYKKGKHDFPFLGFDECSLPLVIYHNTPNNSFPIIWGLEDALFPRVTRHKDVN